MSYVIGAFVIAALVIAALIVPAFRLATGMALLIGGIVAMAFAMFFGPPVAAIGLVLVLIELHLRHTHAHRPA